MLVSCVHGAGGDGEADDADSLDNDTSALEQLDLYEPMVIPESADELFDDFFYSFLEDEDFRNKRIKVEMENQSVLMKEAYAVIYEREEDLALRKDTTVSAVSLEWINWEDEDMENYKFERLDDGHWFMTEVENENMERSPNGQFLSFLRNFFTDADFRNDAVQYPLTMIIAPQEEGDGEETVLDEEQWSELYEQLPDFFTSMVCVNYGQTAISQNRKTLLLEGLSTGLAMRFAFANIDGDWKLIKIEN